MYLSLAGGIGGCSFGFRANKGEEEGTIVLDKIS